MQTDEAPIMREIAALPNAPTDKHSHLPSDTGWPIFGRTFDLLGRPVELIEGQRRRLGSVYRTNMFFKSQVHIGEPDAAELILMDREQNFSSSKGWLPLAPLFERGILLRDFNAHRIHRRPLQAAFKSAVMNEYAAQLNHLISTEIKNWVDVQDFKFQPAIKSLLLDNAAELFLGAELGEESNKLNSAFVALLEGVVAVLRYDIPGFAWHRAMKGKRYLTEWLDERFEERLTSDSNDFFTALCKASQDPEHAMSKQEVIEHTLLLLFAAHDTTTSTLSAMFSLLCENSAWQQQLRKECQSMESNTLGFGDLSSLTQCDWVFKETLRMYPPVFMIPRRAIKAFEFGGYKIPANTAIGLQIHLIHHDPKYWTDPYKFDPERWSDDRKEFKGHPYQYIPFGAGAHKCLGFRFAEMQSKIFMYNFLRDYKISTAPGRRHDMDVLPIPLPKDRLPAKVERL